MKHILNNLSEEEKNSIREQHTGGMKVMTESFSKLVNSKLGDVKPLVNEQSILPAANKLAPELQAADLSCIDVSLFTQTTSDGKKYYVYDIPSSISGGVVERVVFNNDGTGHIIKRGIHEVGKWKCGTSGVEFRMDSDPSAVRYLGKITAPPVKDSNTTSNCATSLDEIKQGSNKMLMRGCKTDAVKKLQEMLGMEVRHQTGFFGDITKGKVIEFQKANKDAEGKSLVPDGIVGPKTYGAMVASKAPSQTDSDKPTANLRGVTNAVRGYVPKLN